MDLTDQIKTRRSAIKSMFTTIVVASTGMFGIVNAYPRNPINEEWFN